MTLLHFRSGTASMAERLKVLAVLVKFDGARATPRQIQGQVWGDRYGATQVSTALFHLRDAGFAEFEGFGRRRFWFVTDAGRAHHAETVANSAPFGTGA